MMTQAEHFYNQILTELECGQLTLPTLPEVALRINDIVADPGAATTDLADAIISDAALAAQLLKVANSPLYRGRDPIDNMPMAVSRLGSNMVRNLVSSLVMGQMFQASSPELEARLHRVWEYCVDVAAIAHVLATKHTDLQPDEAMMAGLIHNIGVLPILMKSGTRPELLQNDTAMDAVIAKLATPIGVAMLKMWAFPRNLIEVVDQHENYHRDSINGPDLVDVIQVATLQSHLNRRPALPHDALAAVPAFKKLGVQAGMHVVEFQENSKEYAAVLALFNRA